MFEIGTKIVSAIKLSSKSSVSGFARLPAEYQEVEYITTDGTNNAWIDTLVTPNQNTKGQIKVRSHGVTDPICGYYAGNDTTDWRIFNSSNKIYMDIPGGSGVGNRIYGDSWPANEIKEYEFGNFYVKYVGSSTNILTGTAAGSFTGTHTIKLNKNDAGNDSGDSCDWFYVKLFDGNTLIRDFVPCYRVSDGVIGMYDLVNDQFYTNAGSGTFTKGRDILYGINSHTLRYYPFASNVADRAGQGATGTVNGTVTYSDNGIAVSGDSGYVTGMTNGIANRDTYTQIFRARYTSFPDNYGLLIGDSSNYNTNSSFAFETGGDGSGYFRVYNFIGSGDVIGAAGQNTPRDTYFHLRVMTADHGSYKLYKDGELYLEGTTTGTINNQPNMNLGRSSYYGSQREGYGEIKDYIVEDIPRSAKKIKDFYNLYYFMSANTVAYYMLEGNTIDETGRYMSGGNSNITYDVAPSGKQVVKMTSSNAGIMIPGGVANMIGSGDFTISLWLYVTGIQGGNALVFGSWYDTSPYPGPNIWWRYDADIIRFRLNSDVYMTARSLASSFENNRRVHLCWTRINGVNRGYVNGELECQMESSIGISNGNAGYIISRYGSTQSLATGSMGSEVIVENVGWEDVKSYYNAKKHLYGIS